MVKEGEIFTRRYSPQNALEYNLAGKNFDFTPWISLQQKRPQQETFPA